MDEQRKYAILFAATILATGKLDEPGSKPWAIHAAITDAVEKASLIPEKIDGRGLRESPKTGFYYAVERKTGLWLS